MKTEYRTFIQKSLPIGAIVYLVLSGISALVCQLPSFDLSQLAIILMVVSPMVALLFGFVSKYMGIQILPFLVTGVIVFTAFLFVQYNETAIVYMPIYLSLSILGYWHTSIMRRFLSAGSNGNDPFDR